MTTTLTACPAPAKLNLFLHVTGRRPDGYHLLQSAFQLIDRCDTLHFALRDDGRSAAPTRCRRAGNRPGDPRRAPAARGQRQAHLGADITVHKVLPMGGGVGGGSSDAATTLMVLNHLWNCGYNRASLMEMGLKLGADVPFFLFGRNAFAEGVGEDLRHC
jgi:4-diphosphocytidyl-2-C-methyl-D-erythritol kinase